MYKESSGLYRRFWLSIHFHRSVIKKQLNRSCYAGVKANQLINLYVLSLQLCTVATRENCVVDECCWFGHYCSPCMYYLWFQLCPIRTYLNAHLYLKYIYKTYKTDICILVHCALNCKTILISRLQGILLISTSRNTVEWNMFAMSL